MRSILFRTMEPMMFRGASEFSPTSRGPQTGAWSRPLPSPSTIAGALATLILQHENRSPLGGELSRWYEEVTDFLGGKGSTVLRGPYLIDGKGNVYVQYKDGLLLLNELEKGLTKSDLVEDTKELDKEKKKFEIGYIDLIGIKISDGSKATEAGLIYSARMVDYGKIGGQKNDSCSIMIEVHKTSDSLENALKTPKIIRLGGEGRLVEVMAEKLQPISEFVRAEDCRTKRLRLYVTTPMLFEASPRLVSKEVGVETGTVFLSSRLNEKVSAYLSEVQFKVASIRITGSLGILGGFSVARAARKPVYAALYPGSVIEITRDLPFSKEDCYNLYVEGLGLFRDLGYGTVIPIPIANHV
ncbi:MAG: type III-B CRISPR module-associated Cmr3 family protein [Nitrososphaerales archaeon]